MSFFDKLKNLASSEPEEDGSIIMKQMDIMFEEAVSKAEAFEKLGRTNEASQKYQQAVKDVFGLVNKSGKNYMYALYAGELFMKLGYTKGKQFFG
jgi:hypothetical protein